jgi:hypothetical protein
VFPFLFTLPCGVTAGVSGFEGREVFLRWSGYAWLWYCIQYSASAALLMNEVTQTPAFISFLAMSCHDSVATRHCAPTSVEGDGWPFTC